MGKKRKNDIDTDPMNQFSGRLNEHFPGGFVGAGETAYLIDNSLDKGAAMDPTILNQLKNNRKYLNFSEEANTRYATPDAVYESYYRPGAITPSTLVATPTEKNQTPLPEKQVPVNDYIDAPDEALYEGLSLMKDPVLLKKNPNAFYKSIAALEARYGIPYEFKDKELKKLGLTKEEYRKNVDSYLPKMGDGGQILTGAVSGAATGSALGPWGTVAGAVIGGVAGYLSDDPEAEAQKQLEKQQEEQKAAQEKALRTQTLTNNLNTANAKIQGLNSNNVGLGTPIVMMEMGGYLNNDSGVINTYRGQTHNGPNEGIQVDQSGQPTAITGRKPVALTENNEVNWKGYIFSDTLKPNKYVR